MEKQLMDVKSNSIQQIVYIFHFVKETGIIPTFLMDRNNTAQMKTLSGKI